ncbi:hypothetical protein A4H02_08790 [Fervidobacterium thailandense]|uniref:Glutamine amidotransferase type-2 domain-containing protein n=2 Tax=Fervidobacterium thailandense TaxID=1008305 RepID=A0A1E3G0X0_9BACT|nr:hypothetical protein A4H02_08790 [Fervidobacterium thailandense]
MAGFSLVNPGGIGWISEFVSRMAREGKGAPHGDGFGYVLVSDDAFVYAKFFTPIYESNEKPAGTFKLGIVHARKASEGVPLGVRQVHPFYSGEKFFAHNGTVFSAARTNPYESDTFDYFASVKDFENFQGLVLKIRSFAQSNRYSGLNFLMLDTLENALYVCCLFNSERTDDYFVLHYKESSEGFFVFSEKYDNSYQTMANGEVLKVLNGRIVERGNVFDA